VFIFATKPKNQLKAKVQDNLNSSLVYFDDNNSDLTNDSFDTNDMFFASLPEKLSLDNSYKHLNKPPPDAPRPLNPNLLLSQRKIRVIVSFDKIRKPNFVFKSLFKKFESSEIESLKTENETLSNFFFN
jgi:hypothetical protein